MNVSKTNSIDYPSTMAMTLMYAHITTYVVPSSTPGLNLKGTKIDELREGDKIDLMSQKTLFSAGR